MILALILLLAPAERLVLVDEVIHVGPSQWQAVDLALRQRPATIECKFSVERGRSGVGVALLDRRELRRFRGRLPHRTIFATGIQRAGGFRYQAGIGEYVLVIDNRLEERGAADVRLEVALSFGRPGQFPARELSSGRRATVVVLSLLFFAAVVFYAVRRLRGALRSGG
jgi:hypothetical protein